MIIQFNGKNRLKIEQVNKLQVIKKTLSRLI